MFDVETAIEARIAERTKAEKDQWLRLQEQGRARVKVGDARALYADRQIEIALNALKDSDDDAEYDRLAEGYFLQGDFEKAAQTARNEERKTEYERYRDARHPCDCPEVRVGKDRVPPRFIKDVFPNKSISFCTTCKTYASHAR